MAYFGDRFRDALKDGGQALILGVFPKDLPPDYRDHPRLIYWPNDSPQLKSARIEELPVRTRAVVATRWISHSASDRIQLLAKRRNILYMGKLASTGEISKMLHEALPVNHTPVAASIDIHKEAAALAPVGAEPEPPPIVPELFPTPPDGTVFKSITDCIRFYGQREVERPVPPGRTKSAMLPDSYYDGLVTRATAHGFDTDRIRTVGILSNLRVHHRQRVAREAELVKAINAAEPLVAAPVAPQAPPEPLPPDLERLVGWADELELKALTAMELADELRRIVKEHRALRDVRDKYDAMMSVMTGTPSKMNGTAPATDH